MTTLALLLTYAALLCLALAMPRHHRAVFQHDLTPTRRRGLRVLGWCVLAASAAATTVAHGGELAAIIWFGTIAATGFMLTLVLAYAPRRWAWPLVALALGWLG